MILRADTRRRKSIQILGELNQILGLSKRIVRGGTAALKKISVPNVAENETQG